MRFNEGGILKYLKKEFFAIFDSELTIGNHNFGRDYLISPNHASLKYDNGQIMIKDLSSHFGTAQLLINKCM